MKLSSFDAAFVLCVDYRLNHDTIDRIEGIFHPRGIEPSWFIDGAGTMLPPSSYSRLHTLAPKTWQDGHNSFQNFRAFKTMLAKSLESGYETILIAEDDLIITDEFDAVVDKLEVPADWDMFYYGANHSNAKTHQVNEHVLRIYGSTCSHLVAFKRRIIPSILALPSDRTMDWNIANRLHGEFNCYAAWPNIAIQKPGYSHLWHQEVDYSPLWKNKGTPV